MDQNLILINVIIKISKNIELSAQAAHSHRFSIIIGKIEHFFSKKFEDSQVGLNGSQSVDLE